MRVYDHFPNPIAKAIRSSMSTTITAVRKTVLTQHCMRSDVNT